MKKLILVGAGHAHARVLRDLARAPLPGVEVQLISPESLAPYSGMVPGWLAGHYEWGESCIDFAGLCRSAGIRLRRASVVALDADACELTLSSGDTVGYDLLSLNVGSTITAPSSGDTQLLPMRPLSLLQARWDALVKSAQMLPAGSRFHVAMVGGGAAGVETILAADHRLRDIAPLVDFQFSLVTRSAAILDNLPTATIRHAQQHLAARGIGLITDFAGQQLSENILLAEDGRTHAADAFLWATGAQALDWPASSALATDDKGFIQIDANLRSLSHPNILAVGDCARFEPALPKAGVFAVRMGPVLSQNLRAIATGNELRQYVPQRRYLMIIGTGGSHAIASWGRFSVQGAWVWRAKQAIDRRFIASYNNTGDIPNLFRPGT